MRTHSSENNENKDKNVSRQKGQNDQNSRDKKLLIAGGGTGGHVLAGVAIADAWKEQQREGSEVLFVGAQGGLEEKLVPRAGYPLRLLSLGSLNRVSLKRKLRTAFQLPLSILKSAWILIQMRPAAVIGVGGYSSGPVVLMARVLQFLGILKARIAIVEQNSVPGLTNRILGKLVHQVFAAFPGTEKKFPHQNVTVTGIPIRSSMKLLGPAPRNPFVIFIFGGSQGAIGVNTLVLEALPYLKEIENQIRIIHQTGEKDFERVKEGYRKAKFHAQVEKFIYDMPETYAKASLLICRSGASTLGEVAAVGRASVLIPLPTAADNHQEENAKVYAQSGAAVLVNQTQTSGEKLAAVIRELHQHPERLTEMEKQVVQFHKPRAAQDVVRGLVES